MLQPMISTLLALLTLGPVSAEPVASAESEAVLQLDIVDKAIDFHGGARYTASESELDLCSRSGCFHLRVRRDGGLFDVEVTGKVRDGRRRVRWSNEALEVWHDDQPVPVGPSDEQGFKDWAGARIYFPFLPFQLNDPSVYKQDLGLETWDGRRLHRVKVTFEPGSSTDASDQYTYWLDPETGRVEQFAYSYEGSPGGLRFRRGKNYRRVGGILFFDQDNLGMEGEGLSVDQIDPALVADRMRAISVVELKNIAVRALEP